MAEDYKPGSEPYPEQDDRKLFCKFHYKGVLILLIPLLFGPLLLGKPVLAYRMLYLSFCIYLYYVFNVMSQGAIAFLFIVFLPVCGITASGSLCMAHYTDLIFTTFGCVFMGVMMDVSRLSERMAIIVIGYCGSNLRVLQIAIMLLTTVSSVFVNCTFMSAFWMKVAQAVVVEYAAAGVLVATSEEEPYERQSKPYPSRPVVGIFLSIAYGATLGGMLSPFQDPNGAIYTSLKTISKLKPTGLLLLYFGPFLLGLIVTAVWINIMYLGLLGGSVKEQVQAAAEGQDAIKQAMTDKKANMGPWTAHTRLVLVMILITIGLLFTRRPLLWAGWDDYIHKATCGASVAIILMCLIYFAVPANYMFCRYYCCRRPEKEGAAPALVGWKIVNINTPWGHIFMMAAGYGFLTGYRDSGLLSKVGSHIIEQKYGATGCFIIGSLLGTLITTLSPASGVARVTLQTMIMASTVPGGPGAVAVPYATALHNQFLLPMSTASNTIISGWGNIRPFQFLVGGSVPAVFMFICISGFTKLLGESVFKGYLRAN